MEKDKIPFNNKDIDFLNKKLNNFDTIKQQKTPVDKEVDKLISQSVERNKRINKLKSTEQKAKVDSVIVDNKLRAFGYDKQASDMGNKKANETRKIGSPYKAGSFQKIKDVKTGKYKTTFILDK